ncbi:ABC transporter ATP-binding protein [Sphingomicrobium flavum]|uniref:ABC transporter ATP-binding protein n=1 Tax=Sphingomicrobium flavum TaxID=1229164 RepID=UPI0021AD60A4|nr:ABC transporter ATP-binding protein [Sphingomicrobium flavum]
MIGRLARLLHDVSGARLWLLFALMLAGALAETIGLLSLLPLLFLALGGADDGQWAQWLSASGLRPTLEVVLAIFLAAFALRIALGLARDRLAAQLEAQVEASIGERAAWGLAALPFAEVAIRGRGDMQSLLSFDIPRAGAAASLLVGLASQLALLLVATAAAMLLSPLLTLVGFGAGLLILAIAAPRWIGSQRAGERITALHSEQDAMAQGMFGALKAAKAQGSGDALARSYGARLAAVTKAQAGLEMRQATNRAIIFALSAITIAAMILLGARGLDLELATLGTLLLLFARLIAPVQAMQRMADQLFGLLPAFARALPLLEALAQTSPAPAQPFARLEAEGLALAHDGDTLFEHVHFALAPGEWLAICGASGAGKTGLIDMIAGLQEPNAGSIRVDGEAPGPHWAAGLAYVPQADLILHDSIAANLSIGSSPDEAEMRAMLALVELDRPLDMRLSELGGALSGGERQRLLIARALCRQPHLLLLDESLSALDPAAAAAMIARLRAALPEMAAILITHHDALAQSCDYRVTLGTGSPSG